MIFSRSLSPARGRFVWGCFIFLFTLAALAISLPADAKSKGKKNGHSGDKYDKRMAKQEIQLMKKMIDQRQAAINLALVGDLGTTGTAAADVASTVTTAQINLYCKAYAARMLAEQDQLRTSLTLWHKVNYRPRHLSLDDEDEDTLDGLTGDEFTAAMLDMMIGVHMRGIAFEKQADKKGYHPEFKAFAKTAKSQDYTEVAQIKRWIKLYETDDDEDTQD